MARRRKPTKASVAIIGALIFIMFFFVIGSSGESLFLANPFEDFDFLEIDSVFPALDITGASVILADHIKPQSGGGFNYNCNLKMNTLVKISGQPEFDLNTQFQRISPILNPFSVQTRSGSTVETMTSEPRVGCDVIEALDGTRLEYKITTQNLKLNVYSFDQGGNRVLIESRFNGLSSPVIYNDRPDDFDSLNNVKGIFIGSERVIGKPLVTQASSIENKLDPSSTISTRVEFRLTGNLLIEIPFLSQQAGETFRTTHAISDELVHNSLSIVIPVTPPPTTVGGDPTLAITNIDPSVFDTSGRDRIKLLKVTVRLNDLGSNEINPICTVFKGGRDRSGAIVGDIPIAQTTSTFQRTSGVDSFYLCTLKLSEDIPLGTYHVTAKTNASNRPSATSTFEVTRNTPACGSGEKFDTRLQICVKDDDPTPPPTNGEDPTTKPCYSCPPESKVFRTVPIADMCPILQCTGGTTTVDTPICRSDGKPATKTVDGFTCDRNGGGNGNGLGLFPTFLDCEAEGRDADPEAGEICVPPILLFLFTGLNFLWVGLGFIVFIIILALIAKGINRQRSGVFLQG
ncbi:MAG: hypothetical protein KJI69_04030 [Patescibacteria group bacterium]|nr:hypothetical protein [Patescibacteria group bacterium]